MAGKAFAAARYAAVALAAGLAACGDATGPLSNAQERAIGSTLADEVETSVAALTPSGAVVPFDPRQGALAAAAAAAVPPCVDPSPSAASSDADAVPDSAVWTFTVPPCSYDDVHGGKVEVRGQLELRDPTTTTAGFEYAAKLTDLSYAFVNGDDSYTVIRNGTRALSGTTAGLTLTNDLRVLRSLSDLDANVTAQWTIGFTPAQGGSLLLNTPLPGGSIAVAGSFTWSRGAEAFSLTVSTPAALEYDASCGDTPQRIRAGELRAAGTFDGQNGYVRLVWKKCGDAPEVDFVSTQ
ncbi:MAG TPA: hypothetical protein VFK09_05295 [Gemmatimonadales bacterium]|nr:hypothetical protein [Gemmatimonadales bacterium]